MRYTAEHLDFLREQYPKLKLPSLTAAFNAAFALSQSKEKIKSATKRYKIRSGRSGEFVKGHLPKGCAFRPIGFEIIRRGYIEVKVDAPCPRTGYSPSYRLKHRMVWEQLHGPIPEGHIVCFLDCNRANCEPDNLVLLTQRQHSNLWGLGYNEAPAEIRATLLILAKIKARRTEYFASDGIKNGTI